MSQQCALYLSIVVNLGQGAERFLAPITPKARAFKGISGTLKQNTGFSGLTETIWKPFGVF